MFVGGDALLILIKRYVPAVDDIRISAVWWLKIILFGRPQIRIPKTHIRKAIHGKPYYSHSLPSLYLFQ